VPVVVVLFFVLGAADTASTSAAFLVMQRWTPDQVRARSSVVLDGVCSASFGLAIAVAGVLLSLIGPGMVFVLGGSITLLTVSIATRVPPHGRHDHRAPLQPPFGENPKSRERLFTPLPA
jgi:hypothetical protein